MSEQNSAIQVNGGGIRDLGTPVKLGPGLFALFCHLEWWQNKANNKMTTINRLFVENEESRSKENQVT